MKFWDSREKEECPYCSVFYDTKQIESRKLNTK
jgi:hypothetical protein